MHPMRRPPLAESVSLASVERKLMGIFIGIGVALAVCAVVFCWLIEGSPECDGSCEECEGKERDR